MEDEKLNNGNRPEAPDWLIENIAEASKNTRKIYLLYLGFLAYCALTVFGTNDRTLILNEPAHLPIINVGVPLEGFFIVAPLMAIFTFVYLQLNLQNLNKLKLELWKDHPHIKKERLYPWLINVVDDPAKGAMGNIQLYVVSFSLWWSLVVVLILFPVYYVKKHDIVMSYILGSLPLLGTIIVFWFKSQYEMLGFKKFVWKGKLRLLAGIILILLEFFFLAFIIRWSMQGGKYEFLKPWLCVDLSYQVLVNEPETDYEGLYWADFSGVHLEGANLQSSVLKRADLSDAHLKKADLWRANLQEANLRSTNLQEADLRSTNLQEANLFFANLQGARLFRANLQRANLEKANLQGAELGYASLQEADLAEADLKGAGLGSANLQEANLDEADLKGADLFDGDLQGANLYRSNLQGASLVNAKLQGARNLTIEQLSEVKTLYEAKLDSVFYEQIKAQYPHLLEPPPPEEEE
ncbi:MAG: pentapeptide repeat-containing protein [candidate division Zixibacteria bacterium]